MSDRYLVTMRDTLRKIEHYLKAIKTGEADDYDMTGTFNQIFPSLAVVFTKALPKKKSSDLHHIYIDVETTIYKPVGMHASLKASTTSNTSSETTFFGANIQPSLPRHGPRYCERITTIDLKKNSYIRPSTKAIVFPPNSGAVHKRALDCLLSMHVVGSVFGDRPPARQLLRAKETFEAFLSAIPVRREGVDLCNLEIRCYEHEFEMLCGSVSVTIWSSVLQLTPPLLGLSHTARTRQNYGIIKLRSILDALTGTSGYLG